jgi:hypothetical protein
MNTFKDYVNSFSELIGNTVTNLLLTVAVAAFFWSIVTFMWNRSKGNVDATEDAKNKLLWSIIGLFVMFSIWGIITFLQDGLGIKDKNTVKVPSIESSSPN